ncbi:MAG: phosphatase PAP2 family protein [Elusimicrobiaceae bacterium]|nr:phosphatase PAP2 family protein [Elusimicrobiaceae bacterium]
MDIEYLLWLQQFRNSIQDAWTPCLEMVSLFAVTYLVLLPTFIYWTVHKRNGLFTLTALHICVAFNAVLKLTVCAYRPWIRDPRVLPAGNAIETATGYSFPSGHTTTATPIYGGMAVGFWHSPRMRWAAVLCIIAILITGFSRNYLGVHTPQDVGVGLLLGVLSLWGTWKIFAYVDKHPEQENKFLLGGILFSALALLYITYKPYPLDYIDGKLLVDPQKMMNDGYKDIGALAAFCVARYIEKRWIGFEATGLNWKEIIWGIVGLIPLVLLIMFLQKYCILWMGPHWGRLVARGFIVLYIVALYPGWLKFIFHQRAK